MLAHLDAALSRHVLFAITPRGINQHEAIYINKYTSIYIIARAPGRSLFPQYRHVLFAITPRGVNEHEAMYIYAHLYI